MTELSVQVTCCSTGCLQPATQSFIKDGKSIKACVWHFNHEARIKWE